MCGITGYVLAKPGDTQRCRRLDDGGLLTHRGPDAFGRWRDDDVGVALHHYRLAILDLTPAGSQPMQSHDGRYTIVFNGEIYNHLALRASLGSERIEPAWRGHSDTETLLEAIAAWGIERALASAVGMFVLAVYDRATRTLTLARDRLGEKPLYYGMLGGGLCFASEMKALAAVDGAMPLHAGGVATYMRLGYVAGDQSIYEGVLRLSPGTFLRMSLDDVRTGRVPAPTPYWQARDLPLRQAKAADDDEIGAIDRLEGVLQQAVEGQMLSDVPLGALLSGGIDSSLVVALMQRSSRRPVRTFAIGFNDSAVDEAPHARAIARHLGTDHTELYVTAQDALTVVPEMPSVFCEPFADSSQLPTLLVARLARQHVTVALSGDGGDELFAGYDRYARVQQGARTLARVPMPLRVGGAWALRHCPAPALNALARALGNPGSMKNPADRLKKLAGVMTSADAAALNLGLLTLWDPATLMPGVTEHSTVFHGRLPAGPSLTEQLMLADTMCYLPDDLMVKVDRTAMAVSLETRAPFLDHRVVEHAWRMPLTTKVRGGTTKWALKEVLARHVPRALFDRPKQGFGSPIDVWLRGPLRSWAESLLDPASLRQTALFDVALVRRRWQEHVTGQRNWQHSLWAVLMFEAWRRGQQRT